jgi:hypothetical protein
VLAGISTHPPTGVATVAAMVRAARVAADGVDGLWVNVFADHPRQLRRAGRFFRWLQEHRY